MLHMHSVGRLRVCVRSHVQTLETLTNICCVVVAIRTPLEHILRPCLVLIATKRLSMGRYK